jgi:hypothetical protein
VNTHAGTPCHAHISIRINMSPRLVSSTYDCP